MLRIQSRCVRIEDSFATVQESHSYDFGASRKAPKTKETRSKERTNERSPTSERPNSAARPCGSAIDEPRRRRGSAIPWSSPCEGRGPPPGSPTVRFLDIL